MKNQKSNKLVITLLVVIIAILSVLCILFATGTISFNSNKVENNNLTEDETDKGTDNNLQNSVITSEDIKEIFNVAYNYYELPEVYCGNTDNKIVQIDGKDRVASTEFTTYNEMLNLLKKYMSTDVIASKSPWSATAKEYYLEKDGKLYCDEIYKGYLYSHENVEIEITSQNENKVTCTATMELIDMGNVKTYDKVNIVLELNDSNWIITSYEKIN